MVATTPLIFVSHCALREVVEEMGYDNGHRTMFYDSAVRELNSGKWDVKRLDRIAYHMLTARVGDYISRDTIRAIYANSREDVREAEADSVDTVLINQMTGGAAEINEKLGEVDQDLKYMNDFLDAVFNGD